MGVILPCKLHTICIVLLKFISLKLERNKPNWCHLYSQLSSEVHRDCNSRWPCWSKFVGGRGGLVYCPSQIRSQSCPWEVFSLMGGCTFGTRIQKSKMSMRSFNLSESFWLGFQCKSQSLPWEISILGLGDGICTQTETSPLFLLQV